MPVLACTAERARRSVTSVNESVDRPQHPRLPGALLMVGVVVLIVLLAVASL